MAELTEHLYCSEKEFQQNMANRCNGDDLSVGEHYSMFCRLNGSRLSDKLELPAVKQIVVRLDDKVSLFTNRSVLGIELAMVDDNLKDIDQLFSDGSTQATKVKGTFDNSNNLWTPLDRTTLTMPRSIGGYATHAYLTRIE